MFKAIWAVGTAAMVAAVITFFPSLSPEVEASTPAPVAVSASATVGQPLAEPMVNTCERAWPYYGADCLRSPGTRTPARVVTTDRISIR